MQESPALTHLKEKLGEESVHALLEQSRDNYEYYLETGDISALGGMQTFGIAPQEIASLITIGQDLIREGYLDKAEIYFLGFLQLEPLNWRVVQMVALTQHLLKRYDIAQTLYELADSYCEGQDGLTKLYLGECQLHLNHIEPGLTNLQLGIEMLQNQKPYAEHVERAQLILERQSQNQTPSPE